MILPLPRAKVFPCSVIQSGAIHLSLVTSVHRLTTTPQCLLLVWDGRAFHILRIVTHHNPYHNPHTLLPGQKRVRYKLAPSNPVTVLLNLYIYKRYLIHTTRTSSISQHVQLPSTFQPQFAPPSSFAYSLITHRSSVRHPVTITRFLLLIFEPILVFYLQEDYILCSSHGVPDA